MYRLALTITCACLALFNLQRSFADDAALSTTLKTYSLGNLASINTIQNSVAGIGGEVTKEVWASEHEETLKALDDLKATIEAMCTDKPLAVRVYEPTLSLVVRHTDQGHREISELLEMLQRDSEPVIQLDLTAIPQAPEHEPGKGVMSEDESQQAQELMAKAQLSSKEVTALLKLLSWVQKPQKKSIKLRAGRRTTWGIPGLPCSTVGRIDPSTGKIEIRIDFIANDVHENKIPVGMQTFSLSEGESGILHHFCDGGYIMWIVSPTMIKTKVNAVASKTAGANAR